MAEWLRRLIRNQLEAIPREFESLCCRNFIFFYFVLDLVQGKMHTLDDSEQLFWPCDGKKKSDTLSFSAFDLSQAILSHSVSDQFLQLTSIKWFRHLRYCNVKVCLPAKAELECGRLSGDLQF